MTGLDWLRHLLGPDPATRARVDDLTAEVRDLEAQVDQLAYDRDNLTEQLASVRQSADDLRAHNEQLRKDIRAAYEPLQADTCRKVRYHHRDDAHEHARDLACNAPGVRFHTYRCTRCPSYPRGGRPWHVAHCRHDPVCADAISLLGDLLVRGCGCIARPPDSTHAATQPCLEHRRQASA